MLEIADKRASDLGREVDLRVGDAQALDFHLAPKARQAQIAPEGLLEPVRLLGWP
jgi:hypothetical protein